MGQEYYLAIDVGGTKTLLAVFNDSGQIVMEEKIKTSDDYQQFEIELAKTIDDARKKYRLKACGCAITAMEFDRQSGIGKTFGNLGWTDVPIKDDLSDMLDGLPVFIDNDAKLAGLYEYNAIGDIKRLLYITLGTGVGIAFIVNGIIDTNLGDAGGRGFTFEYEGKETAWDDIASGRALAAKYGKKASEITDPKIWQEFVVGLARGMEVLVGLTEPDAIVVGGGVGAHFEKFEPFLKEELHKYKNPKLSFPPIIKAQKPEEAVIYGCYDYIKQNLS